MPRSNTGPSGRTLTGGRALYTGKNAYASQGFENDTRQSQLGGLVVAYPSDQTMVAATATLIDFSQVYLSGTFQQLFMRWFSYDSVAKAFTCTQTGTYRFAFSLDVTNLVAAGSAVASLKVFRGLDGRTFYGIVSNPDAANALRTPVGTSGIIDLQNGDLVSVDLTTTNAALVAGFSLGTSTRGGKEEASRSFFMLEQVDLT